MTLKRSRYLDWRWWTTKALYVVYMLALMIGIMWYMNRHRDCVPLWHVIVGGFVALPTLFVGAMITEISIEVDEAYNAQQKQHEPA